MSTLKEKLLHTLAVRKREREHTEAKTWAEFVAQVADGKIGDADEILDRLDEFKQTPESLDVAIDGLKERRRLQLVLKDEPAARKELARLEADQAAFEETMRQTKAQWRREEQARHAELAAARARVEACDEAHRRLHVEAPAVVRQSLNSVEAELAQLGKQRDFLRRMLGNHSVAWEFTPDGQKWERPTVHARRAQARTIRQRVARTKPANGKTELARADEIEAAAAADEKRLKTELAAVEKQLARLERQREQEVAAVVQS